MKLKVDWEVLIPVALVCGVMGMVVWYCIDAAYKQETQKMLSLGRQCLREQKSMSKDEMFALFEPGKEVNVATVVYGDRMIRVEDHNNSYGFGRWVASRVTEFAEGFDEGLTEPPKHGEHHAKE